VTTRSGSREFTPSLAATSRRTPGATITGYLLDTVFRKAARSLHLLNRDAAAQGVGLVADGLVAEGVGQRASM
jgi:hypothetical protein